MKISKIAKILPVALALSLSIGMANADGDDFTADAGTTAQSDPVKVMYSLTLNDFVKITTNTTANVVESESKYHTDYGRIKMDTPLQATFKVISNAEQRKISLKGECPGGDNAIKWVSANKFQLIFGNSNHVPTNVDGILGTPDAHNNPNAIAFLVTLTPTRELGPNSATPIKSDTWDTDHIEYVIQNGHTTFQYDVDQENVENTFNTYDMDGLYTATLTMSDLGAFTGN